MQGTVKRKKSYYILMCRCKCLWRMCPIFAGLLVINVWHLHISLLTFGCRYLLSITPDIEIGFFDQGSVLMTVLCCVLLKGCGKWKGLSFRSIYWLAWWRSNCLERCWFSFYGISYIFLSSVVCFVINDFCNSSFWY